ncbi:preprotein translocase subunit SecY [Candidatus Micrarchaeota archaeon]|nr:preprotein translocase subunit SecY [Candidatus Micrarchaeota archaeon]
MIIDILHSISKYLPVIKAPVKPVNTKERLMWSGIALVIFYMLYETTALGLNIQSQGVDFLQTITASRIGSLLTAGIGPIVLASIFLQLFSGAGLIKLNLKDTKDKQKFMEVQKVLAIVLAILEGVIFVITSRVILVSNLFGLDSTIIMALVVIQIALGSVIVLFLDELVTKYGLGSGISLFIAAGVSLSVVVGLFQLIFGAGGVVSIMAEGGAEAFASSAIALMPFVFTVIVFFVVVYAESVKVEIPIAFERVRGMVPKLPLKFFYVSNIPVIFATALIINAQLFAGGILVSQYWDKSTNAQKLDFTGGYSMDKDGILPAIAYVNPQGQIVDGLLYFLTPILGGGRSTQEHWNFLSSASTPIFKIPEWVHAILYTLFLGIVSVVFGMFWVEIANMDAKSVAGQLSDSGIQIPGFRRDPRMLESILNKHIYPLTIMGSFAVGLLAGIADFTGALGTGTGILLSVGILHKMYEDLEQMNAFELYPTLGKMIGQ